MQLNLLKVPLDIFLSDLYISKNFSQLCLKGASILSVEQPNLTMKDYEWLPDVESLVLA